MTLQQIADVLRIRHLSVYRSSVVRLLGCFFIIYFFFFCRYSVILLGRMDGSVAGVAVSQLAQATMRVPTETPCSPIAYVASPLHSGLGSSPRTPRFEFPDNFAFPLLFDRYIFLALQNALAVSTFGQWWWWQSKFCVLNSRSRIYHHE